jgi:hypothetical protein
MGFQALKNDRKSKGIFIVFEKEIEYRYKEIFVGRPTDFEQQFLEIWSEVFEIFY